MTTMAYMATHQSESCIEQRLIARTHMARHGLEIYLFVKDGRRQRCIWPATNQRASLVKDGYRRQQRLWLVNNWNAALIKDVYERRERLCQLSIRKHHGSK